MRTREAPDPEIEIPPGMLDALVAAELARPDARLALETHYCLTMPSQLAAQLRGKGGGEDQLFSARIDLRRMPRLRHGLEQLFALVARAGVQCASALGAATPEGLVQGRSFGEIYSACHFGRSMPMLYAYPGDLTGEARSGRSVEEWIDSRYVGPLVHELAHLHAAEVPAPGNLHEALAAFIGSEAWPEQLWPEEHEDALPGGAWYAALGGFIARALSLEETVRAQAGLVDLRDALGAPCAEALRLYGFLPFLETGAPHLLSDAFQPGRWWKLIDLHRAPRLARDFHRRFVDPLLCGGPGTQRDWDAALDALPWQELPSWSDAPAEMDGNLALRADRALRVRAERRGMSFRAVRHDVPLQVDRARCELRSPWPDRDAVGAPPFIAYPPPLCRTTDGASRTA
ncbi:MAG TPA: hypothetical protein VF993_14705 [Myxococcales bacterium]